MFSRKMPPGPVVPQAQPQRFPPGLHGCTHSHPASLGFTRHPLAPAVWPIFNASSQVQCWQQQVVDRAGDLSPHLDGLSDLGFPFFDQTGQ